MDARDLAAMSAHTRHDDRYPAHSEKCLVPGASFKRLKRQDHKRQREATKRALRTGWEPPARKRNILYYFL